MALYRIKDKRVSFLKPTSFKNERMLQNLCEANLETLFNAKFIASEFVVNVDGVQNGRIDTLCMDNENSPVIIEYKKKENSSIINQGLFYLEWMMTHRGDYEIAVQKILGKDVAVNWSNPRVIVVAETFNAYDIYGVRRMNANIELWTYHYFDNEYLSLETIYISGNKSNTKPVKSADNLLDLDIDTGEVEPPKDIPLYTLEHHTNGKSEQIKEVFDAIRERVLSLQSENNPIVEIVRKMYVGFKTGKNFCEVHLYKNEIVMWLDMAIEDIDDPHKLCKDVRNIGHWGTGAIEVRFSALEDVDKVMCLIEQSYRHNI